VPDAKTLMLRGDGAGPPAGKAVTPTAPGPPAA
jgi:hypothetical protein